MATGGACRIGDSWLAGAGDFHRRQNPKRQHLVRLGQCHGLCYGVGGDDDRCGLSIGAGGNNAPVMAIGGSCGGVIGDAVAAANYGGDNAGWLGSFVDFLVESIISLQSIFFIATNANDNHYHFNPCLLLTEKK